MFCNFFQVRFTVEVRFPVYCNRQEFPSVQGEILGKGHVDKSQGMRCGCAVMRRGRLFKTC